MDTTTAASTEHRSYGIALVAHDDKKDDLLAWAATHRQMLATRRLYATRTTGALLRDQLELPVHCFRSGAMGGDQQIGAAIVNGDVHLLVFFWDPLGVRCHESDVRALLRLATLYEIGLVCNRATADLIVAALPRVEMSAAIRLPATT